MAASIPTSCTGIDHCFLCKCNFTRVPKLLACFHSLCEQCVEKEMEDLDVGDILPCPQCNMATTVPADGVDGLPDDFLQETKQQLALFRDGNVKYCNVCEFIGDEILAFFYCVNCQFHLCERDKKRHKVTPSQRDHRVISCEEMDSGKHDPEIIAALHRSCHQHSQPLSIYCKDCNIPLCKECILPAHGDHERIPIQDVSNKYQTQVAHVLDDVCIAREENMGIMEVAQMDMDDVYKNKEKLIAKIENRGKHLVTVITDITKKMIGEVQSKFSREEEMCEAVANMLKEQSLCLENMTSYIQQCLNYSSDVFIITHKKEITENASSCLNEIQVPHLPPMKGYAFVDLGSGNIEETLQPLFGELEEVTPPRLSFSTTAIAEDNKPRWAERNREKHDQNKAPSANTPKSSPKTSISPFVLDDQWYIPGILDVTVTEGGSIMILTESAVKELTKEESLRTIHKGANMWNIGSFENDIYVSVKHSKRGFIIMDVNGNIKCRVSIASSFQDARGPCGLAVNSNYGTVLLNCGNNGCVYKYNSAKDCFKTFAPGFNRPAYMCGDSTNNYIISDRGNHNLSKYDSSGTKQWKYGKRGAGQGQMDAPKGVCSDSQGHVYVADSNNDRIHTLSDKGVFISYVNVETTIKCPVGLHFNNGKLYVASQDPDMLSVILCNS